MKTVFIDTFHYSSYPVQVVCVDNGEPWFRASHVATILGYTDTESAIKHLDDDDTKPLGELLASSNPDLFVSVYGLHCLVYKSTNQDAHDFRRWVWSDIIYVVRRNTPPENCANDDDDGSNCSEYTVVGREEDEEEEEEEEDEDSLCNRLLKYVRKAYTDAEVVVGRAEHKRVSGFLKGWQSGIVVIRKLQNGLPDVFTINLNQKYETAIVAFHEHYKEAMRAVPLVEDEWFDFSTNSNPKYWLRKLKNKTALMKECDKRGLIIDNPMMTLNVDIIKALIDADTI